MAFEINKSILILPFTVKKSDIGVHLLLNLKSNYQP